MSCRPAVHLSPHTHATLSSALSSSITLRCHRWKPVRAAKKVHSMCMLVVHSYQTAGPHTTQRCPTDDLDQDHYHNPAQDMAPWLGATSCKPHTPPITMTVMTMYTHVFV